MRILFLVLSLLAVVGAGLVPQVFVAPAAQCVPMPTGAIGAMGAFVTPPPHPDLVKRATMVYYCTGVMANAPCPTVSGIKGNCVVVSSTGQCCYETNINNCKPGGDCRDFTAGCGTACCTEAFPYCNTQVVPGDAVYPNCEQTKNPTFTNSYYLDGNTPPIGILTATRTDPGSSTAGRPGSSSTVVHTTYKTAPAATSTSATPSSGGLSGGAIAGIAIGGAAGLSVFALGIFFLFFRKKPAAPTPSGGMAQYTQQEHLQQYAPGYRPGHAQGQDPQGPKPYHEQQPVEAPANEVTNIESRPTWELPANNN